MKLADFLPARPNVQWQPARQVGVRYAVCKRTPELTDMKPPWDIGSLRKTRTRLAEAGITLHGLAVRHRLHKGIMQALKIPIEQRNKA